MITIVFYSPACKVEEISTHISSISQAYDLASIKLSQMRSGSFAQLVHETSYVMLKELDRK